MPAMIRVAACAAVFLGVVEGAHPVTFQPEPVVQTNLRAAKQHQQQSVSDLDQISKEVEASEHFQAMIQQMAKSEKAEQAVVSETSQLAKVAADAEGQEAAKEQLKKSQELLKNSKDMIEQSRQRAINIAKKALGSAKSIEKEADETYHKNSKVIDDRQAAEAAASKQVKAAAKVAAKATEQVKFFKTIKAGSK
eukprot:TRINITY_DN94628_c0_g1_i1.p1 TRINITY_DN94628_c0_g1~~TRINITY_DN94628_c0_g1_i1.p1  ORF type:complete len:194 (-),score=73.27 TRINITY_DN94628_c0_g1_i1:132-713(-)